MLREADLVPRRNSVKENQREREREKEKKTRKREGERKRSSYIPLQQGNRSGNVIPKHCVVDHLLADGLSELHMSQHLSTSGTLESRKAYPQSVYHGCLAFNAAQQAKISKAQNQACPCPCSCNSQNFNMLFQKNMEWTWAGMD